MSYLLTTYHWPLLSRPQVAGFDCPVTISRPRLVDLVKWFRVKFCGELEQCRLQLLNRFYFFVLLVVGE
jgi:hypothetical protein